MDELGVSVVIPTLNRDGFLYDSVKDMINQKYPNFEIIIVDQSDKISPEIEELSKKHSDIIRHYHNVGFKGLPHARNFGWQHAKYEIVLYIDDDIRANSLFIYNHSRNYSDTMVSVVGGRIKEIGMGDDDSVGRFNPWTFGLTTNFYSDKTQYIDHAKGCNFSIRKSILRKINGFDEALNVGAALYEELELMLRVKSEKGKILFDANAELHHLAAPTGGCRIPDVPKYMYSLAHNRSLVIERHLAFYHKPTAYGRLLLLGLSYSRSARSFKPFLSTIRGMSAGRKAGALPVVCSDYKDEEN